MGEEISKFDLENGDPIRFQQNVTAETKLLGEWFQNNTIDSNDNHFGLEIEGCLVDQKGEAAWRNADLLKQLDRSFVPELAKFNFEYNGPCFSHHPHLFSEICEDLKNMAKQARAAASSLKLKPIWTGILPTLKHSDLELESITPQNRYYALTKKVMEMRGGEAININIDRFDSLNLVKDNVMAEAAATSLQIHTQVKPEDAVRAYNASMILSGPCLAIMTNSPFLHGKKLWDETRIPIFEQSLEIPLKYEDQLHSVTMGDRYLKSSLFELFEENLERYQTILPVELKDETSKLRHLKFLNGQIWRWVRPIVGVDYKELPHIRLEQRCFPSGPSEIDMTANMAFYLGLLYHFTYVEGPLEKEISFLECKENFYRCAKWGLKADVLWQGRKCNVQSLLHDQLLEKAKLGLKALGISSNDISFFLCETMSQRIRTGWTGAAWQKSYIDCVGNDFKAMTLAYIENQESGLPVTKWKV